MTRRCPESSATRLGRKLEDDDFGLLHAEQDAPGRFGQAEDIANAALYQAFDESSSVTGTGLVVDGGMKVW